MSDRTQKRLRVLQARTGWSYSECLNVMRQCLSVEALKTLDRPVVNDPKSSSPGEPLTPAEIDEAVAVMRKLDKPAIVVVYVDAECSCDVGTCNRHPWRHVSKVHPFGETQEERRKRVEEVIAGAGYFRLPGRAWQDRVRRAGSDSVWRAWIFTVFRSACDQAYRSTGEERRKLVRVIATCDEELAACDREQEGLGR